VRLEGASRGKLAEFMPDHVLSHINGDERFPVMHAEGVSYKIRSDCGPAGPSLDGLLGGTLNSLLDFFEQVIIDKETFLDGTSHGARRLGLLLTAWLAAVMVDDNLGV
jgi:hypothetical protein